MLRLIVFQVVLPLAVGLAAYVVGYRRGKRIGAERALVQLRADIDETYDEWTRRGDEGDVARLLELPGIGAVRRMLGQ